MKFKKYIKKIIYSTDFLLFVFCKIKFFLFSPKSQSNESKIILKLIKKYKIKNLNFLEIGFSPWEFNCCSILNANKSLIIDANNLNIKIGKWILKKTNFILKFLDLENINKVLKNINFPINILSLDIDGNDYYLMKKLLILNPSLVVCEFNPIFFTRPISSVYKKNFDRTKESDDWIYYGCSLKGWEIIMKKYNYSLVSISKSGVNAFFVKNFLIKNNNDIIKSKTFFKNFNYPKKLYHKIHWPKIKNKKFKKIY